MRCTISLDGKVYFVCLVCNLPGSPWNGVQTSKSVYNVGNCSLTLTYLGQSHLEDQHNVKRDSELKYKNLKYKEYYIASFQKLLKWQVFILNMINFKLEFIKLKIFFFNLLFLYWSLKIFFFLQDQGNYMSKIIS